MTIHHGDCLEVMAAMEPASLDAIVTDPPYGLEFMGKEWDKIRPTHGNWNDAKWAGKGLTQKQGAATAGRPTGVGSLAGATPSSSYALNRRCEICGKWQSGGSPCSCESPSWAARSDYRAQGMQRWHQQWAEAAYRVAKPSAYLLAFGGTRTVHRMTVALEDAGWIIRDMLVWAYASGFPKSKASLKPAWEPIVMARKPGPLRDLAIDACRIGTGEDKGEWPVTDRPLKETSLRLGIAEPGLTDRTLGRWPANVILTDPIFDGGIEGVVGGGETLPDGDSGTYSRFFLIPKADRAEREPIGGMLPERIARITEGHGRGPVNTSKGDGTGIRENRPRSNVHPTVKPVDLMRHLVRLVTPSGGMVLDPFLGSGTTGIACEMEGFDWIGIEREAEYVRIAEARLVGVQRGFGLSA